MPEPHLRGESVQSPSQSRIPRYRHNSRRSNTLPISPAISIFCGRRRKRWTQSLSLITGSPANCNGDPENCEPTFPSRQAGETAPEAAGVSTSSESPVPLPANDAGTLSHSAGAVGSARGDGPVATPAEAPQPSTVSSWPSSLPPRKQAGPAAADEKDDQPWKRNDGFRKERAD